MNKQERINVLRMAKPLPYGNVVVALSALLLVILSALPWYSLSLGISAWFTLSVLIYLLCWHSDRVAPSNALHKVVGWWVRTCEEAILGKQLIIQNDLEQPLAIRRRFEPVHGHTALVWYLGGWIIRRGRVVSDQERLAKWRLHRVVIDAEHGQLTIQLHDPKESRPTFRNFYRALWYLQEVRREDVDCWEAWERIVQSRAEARQRVAEQRQALVRRDTPPPDEMERALTASPPPPSRELVNSSILDELKQ